jgi:hypothetical protein
LNSELELHVLTCEKDFMDLLWALKTFYFYSKLKTRLTIHDDGTLNSNRVRTLKTHFANCQVVMKNDADIYVGRLLKDHEFCSKYRFDDRTKLGIKLFDFVFYSQTKKIIFLDSDVLFFKKPAEINEFITAGKNFFLSDYMDAFSLPRNLLHTLLGLEIECRVNTGLMFINVEKIYDLVLIESFLKAAYERDLPQPPWAEQTAWALIISKYRHLFVRLPNVYQISQQRITETTVSHHFVNDGSRIHFHTKGLRYIKSGKFLNKLNGNDS